MLSSVQRSQPELPRDACVDDFEESQYPTLLYIISPNFAGSTLVTSLLARHKAIATVGELKASAIGDVERYTCSCGEQFLECPFWIELREAMRSRGHDFELRRFGTHFRSDVTHVDVVLRTLVRNSLFEAGRRFAIRRIPSIRVGHNRILEANLDAIRAITRIQGGSVFLDSSKDPNRLLYLAGSERLKVKVLEVVRDGRGVSNSMRRHFGMGIAQAGVEWKRKAVEIKRTLDYFERCDVLTMGYEAFCSAPEAWLDRIVDFAGVSSFPSDGLRPGNAIHLLGNDMRLIDATAVVLDEKWRTAFDEKDHFDFEASGGDFNRQLGYSSTPDEFR